jgi:hypothetical protein
VHVDKASLTQNKPTNNYLQHGIRFVKYSAHPVSIIGLMRSNNLQECYVIYLYTSLVSVIEDMNKNSRARINY